MAGARLPYAPNARCLLPLYRALAGQTTMKCANQVSALGLGNQFQKRLERIGKQHAGAALIKPFELPAPEQKDAAQHQLTDAVRMRLGVSQAERAAPRATEHLPALDAEVLAQLFDVGHQV